MAGKGNGGSGMRAQGGGRAPSGGSSAATRRVSPAVYRRRRIAVLTLMLLILAVLGVGVWAAVAAVSSVAQGPNSGPQAGAPADPSPRPGAQQEASAHAGPTPSSDPAPSASPTPTPTPRCDPHLITIAASTDKASYAPAEKPVFTLKVGNGNAVPCEINVGTTQMEFLVVSGTDRIFSSKDCQANAQDLTKIVAAGASETANFPWDRVRSTEGCQAVNVLPKPGIYVMTASLGSVTSSKAVFELK